jgi:hypothetical protein
LKIPNTEHGWGTGKVVECRPSKPEAECSNPCSNKNKKKKMRPEKESIINRLNYRKGILI